MFFDYSESRKAFFYTMLLKVSLILKTTCIEAGLRVNTMGTLELMSEIREESIIKCQE